MILEDEASRNIKDLLDRVDKVAENQAIMMPLFAIAPSTRKKFLEPSLVSKYCSM